MQISNIFIANRGEIAQRILHTAQSMGIHVSVPVSDSDKELDYVSAADQVYPVSDDIKKSFLSPKAMIDAAIECNATAIHPGYGFLSENPDFAQQCQDNDLIWIGPSPNLIKIMGNKQDALELAEKSGIPVLKRWVGMPKNLKNTISAEDLPVLIKATNGGGGKGMQIVEDLSLLEEAMLRTQREAKNLFGSDKVFVESYIPKARHIEVQILGDNHGNVIHLGNRECSVQRRFQKIIEEAPAQKISPELEKAMFDAALKISHLAGYINAGTVEFLVDGDAFYFLEMNTRIQVEHPVTEMITGIDIVKEQIKIASGKALSMTQDKVHFQGHAIECRIYAENPEMGFAPSPGEIKALHYEKMENLRYDSAIRHPQQPSFLYDALIVKVISHGNNRKNAISLMQNSLSALRIAGIVSTTGFMKEILASVQFEKNTFHTTLLDEKLKVFLENMETKYKNLGNTVVPAAFALFRLCSSTQETSGIWHHIGYWRNVATSIYFSNQRLELEIINKNKSNLMLKVDSKIHSYSEVRADKDRLRFTLDGQQFVVWEDQTENTKELKCTVDGFDFHVRLHKFSDLDKKEKSIKPFDNSCIEVKANLPGKVVKLNVKKGSRIKKGEALLILESMKIENQVQASMTGVVTTVNIAEGQQLKQDDLLLIINAN